MNYVEEMDAAIIEKMSSEQSNGVSLNHEGHSSTYSGEQLLNMKVDNIPCLLEPILPKVGLVALAGSSDTGKSSLLRQLAVSICLGEERFLDWQLKTEHKKAYYVSTEDDENAIAFLLNKTNQDRQLPASAYSGLTFDFDSHQVLERLNEKLAKNPVDIVIVDAFTDLYGKSMNDTNQVRSFLNGYSQLAQKHKCLVMFLHHTGKRTEDLTPSKHNLLGSQGFEAKMRLVMELRNDSVQPNKRHLCIVKGNYLPKEHKTESYVLLFDDSLRFHQTGDRIHFGELGANNKTSTKETVRELNEQGLNQSEIATRLGISQPTVSRYLKE
ncbi:ATP-binding protein [Allomuricauda sp. ARW1Y1]|jgi:archaellum biogenesis ATPase FlaH|uniref:ATP-binding protein n=1 Tax=Allomuricauda sp. ARW1Y1 TaxID=2663843 RepID=UPI0015CB68C1|nr:AAA family ATPase [Muricauda sp. ARW1Y1]NYJ26331.1 archaellum biogenesis ATPase FlaH [Muricauda sp. ARW1Y1]